MNPTLQAVLPWIIYGCGALLLAWLIGQHFKEEQRFIEAEKARLAPLNQFLKDWGESEDAHKNIA